MSLITDADGLAHLAGATTFVQTEHGHPTSIDPLDADQSQNIRFARMIYATPLEVSPDGVFSSSILESYTYDPKTRIISWRVRGDQVYSDGTRITPTDVAFAVARMARARPGFPVIQHIAGVREWLPKASHQLFPKGIKVDGQLVTIEFAAPVEHPLFRFTLELFSVVPVRAVDLATNKLKSENPPFSGYYQFDGILADTMEFRLRHNLAPSLALGKPTAIVFRYQSLSEVVSNLSSIGPSTVILASDSEFTSSQLDQVTREASVFATPASWFAGVVFNPNWPSLADARCRRFLAAEIRETVRQSQDLGLRPESSIFTAIVPGYLTEGQLAAGLPSIATSERNECLSILRKNPPVWGLRGAKRWHAFETIIRRTYARLDILPAEPSIVPGGDELVDIYKRGKIGLLPAGSGFWALDPAGDVKMLFTRNLHPVLSVVANDDKLQDLLAQLGADGSSRKTQYEEINRHLYETALYNIYGHSTRLYIAKKGGSVKHLPLGLTLPPPWMLFTQ